MIAIRLHIRAFPSISLSLTVTLSVLIRKYPRQALDVLRLRTFPNTSFQLHWTIHVPTGTRSLTFGFVLAFYDPRLYDVQPLTCVRVRGGVRLVAVSGKLHRTSNGLL